MGVSKRKRFEVFKRDFFACQYCGRKPPEVTLEPDHIVPRSKGGGDEMDNLVTSCRDCNSGKSDKELSSIPVSLSSRMKDKKERAAQMAAYNQFLQELRDQESAWINDLGAYWYNGFCVEQDRYVFGTARQQSIRRFLDHLTPVEIQEAMDIASRKPAYGSAHPDEIDDDDRWRYFCGVCWTKIKNGRM